MKNTDIKNITTLYIIELICYSKPNFKTIFMIDMLLNIFNLAQSKIFHIIYIQSLDINLHSFLLFMIKLKHEYYFKNIQACDISYLVLEELLLLIIVLKNYETINL